MVPESIIKRIQQYISSQPDIVLCYLFGSMVKGNTHAESDIDLAMLFSSDTQKIFKKQALYMVDLSSLLHTSVDVINLDTADISFCHRVISEGILLYDKNAEARITFETKTIRQYFDMKPSLDLYAVSLAKRAREGHLASHI